MSIFSEGRFLLGTKLHGESTRQNRERRSLGKSKGWQEMWGGGLLRGNCKLTFSCRQKSERSPQHGCEAPSDGRKGSQGPFRIRALTPQGALRVGPALGPGAPREKAGLARFLPLVVIFSFHYMAFSAAAFRPAMSPWTTHRARPCWLKPPADSPPQ